MGIRDVEAIKPHAQVELARFNALAYRWADAGPAPVTVWTSCAGIGGWPGRAW